MNKPNTNDSTNNLNRQEQSIIFRLRTKHVTLNNHLNKITKNHKPNCRHCNFEKETVNHFLLKCPQLNELREKYLPEYPTINNCLYASTEQLQKTCKYFIKASAAKST